MTTTTRPLRRVTLYTKPGCHLCEEAEELLEDLESDYDLRVTSIDITTDLAAFERFKYEIPVVVVAGGGTVAGRMTEMQVRRALEAAG